MPEGHVLHRLAHRFNAEFRGQPLSVTSPQGRFPEAALVDATVLERADAIGKHLFLHFSNGHIIHIHLGLIGHFTFEDLDNFRGQIRLRVANREQAANLRGPQWCRLITDDDYARVCEKAGEDPLRDDASPDAVFARVRRSRRTIGSLLMDQQLYAGVGNIYRAETLFRQGISPFRAGRDCSLGELRLCASAFPAGGSIRGATSIPPRPWTGRRARTTTAGKSTSTAAPATPATCAARPLRLPWWRGGICSGAQTVRENNRYTAAA